VNNKGMSTIELIVSFVIISLVAVGMFKSVLDLLDKISFYQSNVNITILKGSITNSVQEDLVHREFYRYDSCGTNCYDITFKDLTTRRFKVDTSSRTIQYGGISDKLPEDFTLSGSILFDTTKVSSPEDKNDSILRIFVPIENESLGIKSDINIVYQYDSRNTGDLPPLP